MMIHSCFKDIDLPLTNGDVAPSG